MILNLKIFRDDRFRFVYSFDMESGFYYRTGIFDSTGCETDQDPFRASYPHLLDVGIMGHCLHGSEGLCIKAGVQCYQDGFTKNQKNMSLKDYQWIVDQSKGRLFQIALGGRGDPDMHENFEEILKYSRANGIVPNMTTSGYGLTEEKVKLIKKYCGAVAVSWYRSKYTDKAIQKLLNYDVKTNIHFVLGNNSIDEAYEILTQSKLPKGINRIIFLLHKPVGLGKEENVLDPSDVKVRRFFNLFNEEKYCDLAGFDSCCVPGLINFSQSIHLNSIDTCEGARYSAYITPDMKMTPCSFDQGLKWAYNLRGHSIEEAWESKAFQSFRSLLKMRCPECDQKKYCLGGCPIKREIVLCNQLQEGIK